MYPQNDDDEEDEMYSEDDEGLNDDIEALRRACTIVGTNLADEEIEENENTDDAVCSSDDDLELFRTIKNRFPTSELKESLSLCTLPPDDDDEQLEDDFDFETLCAVQRRFAAYQNSNNHNNDISRRAEKLVETPEDAEGGGDISSNLICHTEDIRQQPSDDYRVLEFKNSSSLPKSSHVFLDAIKRNRLCQKFLRSKLAQIEARIEDNKKLMQRVKLLKDLQVSCRKVTGRALAQGKDPRIQLISAQRTLSSRESTVNDIKASAMHDGPVENSHAAKYRMSLENFPLTLKPKKWTKGERENLRKGIRQQFQEMVLQLSVDQLSCSEGSPEGVNNLEAVFLSIRDLGITPERIREFLPKVNWDQLASLYVVNRTGAECEAQWLNIEDPLINHSKWTCEEDKKLLFIVQEKGMTNWFNIAASLGSNRTPFQCLARFQRSLNARIIKSEWTKAEDAQLQIAVETFGENDWQSVASTLEGRTGPQCSNRWKKTLDPSISRKGRWTLDESKRLKVAVMLLGPKNWNKIAQFVPGRTGVNCRERWFNCVDPSLKRNGWSEEEDSRLKEAIEECGYYWAKIAKCLPPRTDSECRRRWEVLFPHEVNLLQEARRVQKAALIRNFVDRESERPALGPHDFVPPQITGSASEPNNMNKSRKSKRKAREGAVIRSDKQSAPHSKRNASSNRSKEEMKISSMGHLRMTNGTEIDKKCHTEPAEDDLISNDVSTCMTVTDVHCCDTRKTEKVRKSLLKQNKLIKKEIGTSRCHHMLHLESLEPGDGDHTSSGKNTTSAKKRSPKQNSGTATSGKKRSHKQHPGGNMCNKSGNGKTKKLPGDATDISKLSNDHLDPKNGEQGDASSQASQLNLRRIINMESAECVDTAACETTELSVPSNEDIEKSSLDQPSKCTGDRSIESIEGEHVTSVPCQHERQKRSKLRSKYHSKKVLETMDEDNITLASFFASVNSKSCSKRFLDTSDEDNGTLASFLQNKAKKRKIQAFENDN